MNWKAFGGDVFVAQCEVPSWNFGCLTEEDREISQNNPCPGRDSNRTRPEYKSEGLLPEPHYSVNKRN
jgi:hypothetical protein